MQTSVSGVLEGVRVIDMASMWAGPMAAVYLADQGADVIKVEPLRGDDSRRVFLAPPISGGDSRTFLMVNRNKRGVAIDLRSREGRDIIHRLVKGSDVLIHNMRPGAAENLGYDYETLRTLNSELVYAHITPFGQNGPYASRRGYDRLFQAISGMMGRRTLPDGTPLPDRVFAVDLSTPLAVAYGVSLALLQRTRTGVGQRVETSLLHMAIAMQAVDLIRVENEERQESPPGADLLNQAVYSPYRCADDKWLLITIIRGEEFAALCRALDLQHLNTDPRFGSVWNRMQHNDELFAVLEGVFATLPRDEWIERLWQEDVPCAPILEPQEVFDHPHIRANSMLTEQNHPQAGKVEFVNIPVSLSACPGGIRRRAPLIGEHTDEVLEQLGYQPDELSGLRERKIIA